MSKIKDRVYFNFRLSILPGGEINESLPKKGKILDLGCGYGALSIELARLSGARKIVAWDLDKKKLGVAMRSLGDDKNIIFESKDAIKDKWPKSEGVLASDFLHHLSSEDQKIVINNAYDSLGKNGVFVLKEVDEEDKVRSLMSRLWDKLLYPNDKVYYRGKKEWERILRKKGFRVSSENLVLWFPNSTRLFVCRK